MKLLFYDGFDKCSKCIYLLGIELLELIGKSIHSIGRFLTEIEKFLWSYVEVLTYIKEVRHGRKGSSTFDCTNISGILPNGKTHVSRRYSLFRAQFSEPLGKLFFVQEQPPSFFTLL